MDETNVFSLVGARNTLGSFSDADHLLRLITALEGAVITEPGMAFDLSRSLVESVCKTIQKDRGLVDDSKDDLPKMFRKTLKLLELVPESHPNSVEIKESLRKAAQGFATSIHGLCELRAKGGFASHGRDAYEISLDQIHAEFAAHAAECIICFLFKAHKKYSLREPMQRLVYDDNEEFNQYVDDSCDSVQIFDLLYRPSEVLFQLDIEAYKEKLFEYKYDADTGAEKDNS